METSEPSCCSSSDGSGLRRVALPIARQKGVARGRGTEHIRIMTRTLTAVLIREDEGFVALCPEIDVASQGDSVEDAKANLREAVELFFECASEEEVKERLASESYVSALEVSVA